MTESMPITERPRYKELEYLIGFYSLLISKMKPGEWLEAYKERLEELTAEFNQFN